MMDVSRKDEIGETLESHIAKFLDTDGAYKGFLERLFTSTSIFKIFVKGKTNTEKEDKKCNTDGAPKEPLDTKTTFNVDSESLANTSDLKSEEILLRSGIKAAQSVATVSEEAKT